MPLLYEWLNQALKGNGSGSGTALIYRDTYLSWRGLVHRVDRRAQELSTMGIGEGTWLGVMLGNVPEFVILTLAASKLGAVMVPIDPTTSTRDLDMILDAAPIRALVTRPHGGDTPSPTPPAPTRSNGKRVTPQHAPESRRRLQGTLLNVHLYRRDGAETAPAAAPELALFTADTGGDPKGVLRSASELTVIGQTLADSLDIKAEQCVLGAAPFHHGFGFDLGLLAPLLRGATLYLEDEASTKRFSKLLRDEKIDVLTGSPAGFGALAREVTVKPIRTKGARFVSSGSELSAAVADAFYQRYHVRLLSCYYATETGPISIDRTGKDPTTVGKPFAGVEVRVGKAEDAAGATPAAPRPVWVRSPAVSTSFVPNLTLPVKSDTVPVGTADADGWFRTGDLGYLDKSGRLTLVGREDDVVKIGGKRVALGEVAGCLETFGKVREAEARLVADDVAGPMVVARVVVNGKCRPEELIDHCARVLAPYKVPRQIEICERLD